jgi:hypothetical protein
MSYPATGRSAIRERMVRLLYERGEASEDALIQASTLTGDRRKAAAVLRDLEETEQIMRTARGMLRLSEVTKRAIHEREALLAVAEMMEAQNEEEQFGD